MENTQTAVDWLEDSFRINFNKIFVDTDFGLISQLFKQAKAMEKEQIIDAYEYGYWRGNNEDECESEEYYKNPYCNPNNKYHGK